MNGSLTILHRGHCSESIHPLTFVLSIFILYKCLYSLECHTHSVAPFLQFLSLLLPAPCSTVTCQLYAKCVLNNDTLGKCVCSNDCPSKPRSVCGTDGRTYVTECHMRFASCTQKANVTVQHVGDCSKFAFYNCALLDHLLFYSF